MCHQGLYCVTLTCWVHFPDWISTLSSICPPAPFLGFLAPFLSSHFSLKLPFALYPLTFFGSPNGGILSLFLPVSPPLLPQGLHRPLLPEQRHQLHGGLRGLLHPGFMSQEQGVPISEVAESGGCPAVWDPRGSRGQSTDPACRKAGSQSWVTQLWDVGALWGGRLGRGTWAQGHSRMWVDWWLSERRAG